VQGQLDVRAIMAVNGIRSAFRRAEECGEEEKPPKRARHLTTEDGEPVWDPAMEQEGSEGSEGELSEFDGDPEAAMMMPPGFAYRPTSEVVTPDLDKVGKRIVYDIPGTVREDPEPKPPPPGYERAPTSLQEIAARAVGGRARFAGKCVVPQSRLEPAVADAMEANFPELLRTADRNLASRSLYTLCQTGGGLAHLPYILALLEAGADVEYLPRPGVHTRVGVERRHGKTPLMWAILRGEIPVVHLLLEAKADAMRRDFLGFNSVHWTAVGRSMREIQLRVTHPLEEEVQQFQSWTANLRALLGQVQSQACDQMLGRLENEVKDLEGDARVAHLCSMLGSLPDDAHATEFAALRSATGAALKPAVAAACKAVTGCTAVDHLAESLRAAELPEWEEQRHCLWNKVLSRWLGQR